MAGITDFFKKAIDALGIDIVLLLTVLVIGISLAIVYNGGTAPDNQTAIFSLIYCVMALVVFLVAGAARLSKGKFFRGAEDAITEMLSVKRFPVLGLVYLIGGTIVGFIIGGGGQLFALLFKASQAFTPANFVFQNMFSPIVEEYFYRGFLQPMFEMLLIMKFGVSMPMQIAAFAVAALLQSLMFAFVHIVAFGGNVSQLLGSVIFGITMAILSKLFGLLVAIGVHAGLNLGFQFQYQSIVGMG